MAIKKYKAGDVIIPGQFICVESGARMMYCSGPAEVLSVSGMRVYIKHERKSHIALNRVRFVCDTEADGMLIFDLGIKRTEAINVAVREAERIAAKPFDAELAALLAERPAPVAD